MLIKTFFLLMAAHFLLAAPDNEQIPSKEEVNQKCLEEFSLKEEDVAQLNKTRHLDTQDENLKCYVKCFLTGLKVLNETGDLIVEEGQKRNPRFQKYLDTCKDVTGDNPCDKAVKFQNCIWREIDAEAKPTE